MSGAPSKCLLWFNGQNFDHCTCYGALGVNHNIPHTSLRANGFSTVRLPISVHAEPRRSILNCFSAACLLTTDDVNHAKDNDPHRVDKMPVPRDHLDMLGVRGFHVAA